MIPGAWQIPQTPGLIWRGSSSFVIRTAYGISKIFHATNKVAIHGKEKLNQVLDCQKDGKGVVTISNHHSRLDDPFLWGSLNRKKYFKRDSARWVLVADDICFTNIIHSLFFSVAKCVPVCRGDGVYQKPMDFCLERLKLGEWVHIFPEGKVMKRNEEVRLKWGVGRLVAEAEKIPIFLPMYHYGIEDIFGNNGNLLLTTKPFGQKVTILIGDPVDFTEIIQSMKQMKKTQTQIRKYVTDSIQEQFRLLGQQAKLIHNASDT